jgi:hypothetical protein
MQKYQLMLLFRELKTAKRKIKAVRTVDLVAVNGFTRRTACWPMPVTDPCEETVPQEKPFCAHTDKVLEHEWYPTRAREKQFAIWESF